MKDDKARHPEHAPPSIDQLPEPLRSVAMRLVDELIERGHPRDEALRLAAEQAADYGAERASGADERPEESLRRARQREEEG